jgi:hypothetical protein
LQLYGCRRPGCVRFAAFQAGSALATAVVQPFDALQTHVVGGLAVQADQPGGAGGSLAVDAQCRRHRVDLSPAATLSFLHADGIGGGFICRRTAATDERQHGDRLGNGQHGVVAFDFHCSFPMR